MKIFRTLSQQVWPMWSTAFNTQQSHSKRGTNMKGCHCVHTDTQSLLSTQLPAAPPTATLSGSGLVNSTDSSGENLYMCVCKPPSTLWVTALDVFLMRGHTWSGGESSSTPSWYAATQLIQLSLSAISLPHSICLAWSQKHARMHTPSRPHIHIPTSDWCK